MRAVRPLVVAVLMLVVLATPAVVLADGRVALVVGNSTYAHIGRLPNPDQRRRGHVGGATAARTDREAVRWFRRSANRSNLWAQANLGFMYENGSGVRRDRVEAVQWYRRAAD